MCLSLKAIQTGLNDLNSPLPMRFLQKISKLQRICLGEVRRRRRGGGRTLSRKLSPWPNLMVLSSYMRNRTRPSKVLAPQLSLTTVLPPTQCSHLHSPTLSLHTCLLKQFWWWKKPSPSYFFLFPVCISGRWCEGRSYQIPTHSLHWLKLCYKFCSGIPFNKEEGEPLFS